MRAGRSVVAGRGAVSSGTWARNASPSGRRTGPSTTHRRPRRDDLVTRAGTALVDLRVLGFGDDVRAARRGVLEPALDVLLR